MNAVINMHVGSALKAFVETNWIGKKKELAESMDMTPVALSKLFAKRDLHTKYVRKVCEAMGMNERAFFRFAANHKPKEFEHSE